MEVVKEGITQGVGRATEKGMYALVFFGGIIIIGYGLIKYLKTSIPDVVKIIKTPGEWDMPPEDTPDEDLFVTDDALIQPIIPPSPPEEVGVSGVNWLYGRCATLQSNILNDLELEGKDKVWWVLPLPKGENRWYDCARRIESLRKTSWCDATREEVYHYLVAVADRNLGNRGKTAKIVSRKYKTIYGRRW